MKYLCDICHSEMLGRPAADGPVLCLLCRLSAEEASELVSESQATPAYPASLPAFDRMHLGLHNSSSASL
jgi:hypothetical protein